MPYKNSQIVTNVDLTKWIMLISGVLGFLVPAAIEWRNLKFAEVKEEHKTKHGNITLLILLVWVTAALGLGTGMYRDFSKKEKAPIFLPYVNGLSVTEGCFITVPSTNISKPLELWVENIGDSPSMGVQLQISLAEGLKASALPPWRPMGVLDGYGKALVGSGYVGESSQILNPWDRINFSPPISVELQNSRPNLITISRTTINMVSLQSTAHRAVTFWIQLTNSVGDSYYNPGLQKILTATNDRSVF